MYLVDRGTKDTLESAAMFVARPSAESANAAAWWEMWGSGITEDGPDFCELRLFDVHGRLLLALRGAGY
jgi:hypothetical protein